MVKVINKGTSNTSFKPVPWAWTTNPFPAFRGAGQRYNAFLAVAGNFTPWFNTLTWKEDLVMSDDYCKVIKTKKGTRLLVPCSRKEDEKILLINATGGFRGGFGAIEAVGGEILWENHMSMHCTPCVHIIARITDPEGYVRTESGRRCCHGDTEIFSWKGDHFCMPTEQYQAAVETGTLFATHDTIQSDLEQCKAMRMEQAESRCRRESLLPRLEAVNARLQACGADPYQLGETYFVSTDHYAGTPHHRLYTTETVEQAEAKATSKEAEQAQRRNREYWQPRFEAAVEGYTFTEGRKALGDHVMECYSNVVTVWNARKCEYARYEYTEAELARFVADIPGYEEIYQDELRAKAKADAERRAREQAEEAERLAREAAAARLAQAEAEAKELGLPGNIRIWHRSGRTDAGKAWVIGQNGRERECDFVDTMVCGSSSKRYHQNYEGDHVWNQILPGELVLKWSKAYTAAEHVCEIVYRPETVSEAQLERVAEIQQELDEAWSDLTGLASGKACPAIGGGWLSQLA